METGTGILGRLTEKVLGWIILGLLVATGVAIWQMGPAARAAIWSGIWRTAAWLAVAAALPWSARLYLRRLTELGTNWAPVGLLAVLLALDAAVGIWLLTAWPTSAWSWCAVLAALATAATYNYLVAEYLAETQGT